MNRAKGSAMGRDLECGDLSPLFGLATGRQTERRDESRREKAPTSRAHSKTESARIQEATETVLGVEDRVANGEHEGSA